MPACPACLGGNSQIAVASPADLEYFVTRDVPTVYWQCSECKCLFQDPIPSAEEASSFYGPDYQNYVNTRVPLLAAVYRHLQITTAKAFIRKFGLEARILDYGCGHGMFLDSLWQRGARLLVGFDFGGDPPPLLSRKAQYFSDLDALKRTGQRFSVIRLNHVIEHLSNLDETMELLSALLTDKGVIIGQTPNAAHYTFPRYGASWGPLHFPYHTILLSPTGIARAAPRWGLEVVSCSKTLMPTGWAMSWENLYKSARGTRKVGRTSIYTLLMAASLPFVLWDFMRPGLDSSVFNFELRTMRGS